MALAPFNNTGINKYFASASESDIQSFIKELKSNFDSAVASRFQLDSNYQTAIKNTRKEMKEFITSAVEHFVQLKGSLGSGTLTVSGISGDGNPITPDAVTITCTLTINGGWNLECKVSFKD